MARRPTLAIIFDLDGVLINTVDAHFAGWKAVAHELGVPFSREDNDHLRGIPRKDALASLARKPLGQEREDFLLNLKARVYSEQIKDVGEAVKVPGVELLLTGLRDLGIPIGLASASRHAPMLLAMTGLATLIDAMSDGHFDGRLKPYPDQFLDVAARLGVPPRMCIVIDDSNAGLEAARRAGMRTLAIGDRHGVTQVDLRALDSLANLSLNEFLAACLIDTSGLLRHQEDIDFSTSSAPD